VSPRAREEIVRPRLQSGAGVRPLNFTVRSHLGDLSVSRSREFPSFWLRGVWMASASGCSADVFVQRN